MLWQPADGDRKRRRVAPRVERAAEVVARRPFRRLPGAQLLGAKSAIHDVSDVRHSTVAHVWCDLPAVYSDAAQAATMSATCFSVP